MANPYEIPFRPIDFSGLGEIADVYNRAAQNRDFNDLRRRELDLRERTLSAEEYRKTQEFQIAQEERKRAREVERIKAFDPAKRMAAQSPELATSLYKSPYGFSFVKSADLGPGEEGPQLSPNAPTDRPALPEGQIAAPTMGAMGSEVDAVSGGAATPLPPTSATDPLMSPRPEPMTPRMRLYTDVGAGPKVDGQVQPQWSEVAQPPSVTGFGQKYDEIYENALATGDTTPRQAWENVMELYKADSIARATADRAETALTERDRQRIEHEKFLESQNAKYRSEPLTFDQRLQLARASASVNAPQGSPGVLQAISEYIASVKADPAQMAGAYQLAESGGLLGRAGADIVEKLRDDFKAGKGGPTAAGNVFGPGGKTVATIPASGDPALDRKRAEDVSKANAIYTDLRSKLAQLEEARKGGFALPTIGGFAPSAKGAEREALHGEILLQLKELQRLGVLAGPDMGLMEGQIGSALSNTTGIGASKLGTMQGILDQKHEKFLDTNGLNGRELLPVLRGGTPNNMPVKRGGQKASTPVMGTGGKTAIPPNAEIVTGKVGPNGRAVYRLNGKLYEVD